uniref:Polyribonucleotide 5'-hydroxyl-kinase Clp1 P-loop domain-containing protein n=1 Tax=Globodera rostochiensis TaxID=31243 RepID=A0A914I248_GLORO
MQPTLISLPHLFSTVGNDGRFVQCPCTDPSYTILVFGRSSTVFLSGAFSFQVLYANFVTVSIPQGHLPASFSMCDELSAEVHFERIQSRLREFLNDSRKILPFIEEHKPVAILLVKLEMDIVTHFVKQQFKSLVNIFPPVGKQLGPYLFCLNIAESPWSLANIESLRNLEEGYRRVLLRIGKVLQMEDYCVVPIIGNKGVGKSTMCRYLLNSLNSRSRSNTPEPCRVFLLDLDVGQSELSPPGCVSLFETNKPLIVVFEFEAKSAGEKCVLVVNTAGWIEDLGYDLMLKVIRIIKPNLISCIDMVGGGISFEVPKQLLKITSRIRRSGDHPQLPPLGNSAVLRNLLVVAYFAQTFRQFKMKTPTVGADLRLADTLATYRLPFRSVSIYIHPELINNEDSFMLSVLNCSFVALCRVEKEDEKWFERRHLLGDTSLPSRLLLRPRVVDGDTAPSPNRGGNLAENGETIEPTEWTDGAKQLPILRCVGFGLVRAINPERKLFYVITPVEQRHLGQVDVLALGHCLNTPELIFSTNPYGEAVPYLVELQQNKTIDERHKKLYSPLRVVTGSKRHIHHIRLMQQQAMTHPIKRVRRV